MRAPTRLLVLAVAVISLSVFVSTASADSFTIDFSGSGFTGVLNVDTTLVSSGVYAVDSISGNVGFTPVTGLVAVTTSGGYSVYIAPDGNGYAYDNLLYADSNPALDIYGILFTLAGVAQPVNLYYDTQGEFAIYVGGGSFPKDFVINPVQISVVSAPEPSSLVLGLGGFVFLLTCLAKGRFTAPALSRQNA